MLKRLLIHERKTLIGGFIVCVICIFPFTFMPVIFNSNRSFDALLNRIPLSLLYTVIFSFFVVTAAVILNYQKLQAKEKLFNKAAFTNLGFQLQLEGMNSIIKEISPYLIGIHSEVLYKIDVDIDYNDKDKFQIRILPLLLAEISNNRELAKHLKRNYQLEAFEDLCILLTPKESDLDNPFFLSKHLTVISSEIMTSLRY